MFYLFSLEVARMLLKRTTWLEDADRLQIAAEMRILLAYFSFYRFDGFLYLLRQQLEVRRLLMQASFLVRYFLFVLIVRSVQTASLPYLLLL